MFVSYSSITEWQNLSKTKSRQAVSKSREGEAPVPIYNSEDEMRHKHRPSTTRLSWACSCTSELPTPHSRIVVSLDQIRPLRMYLNPSVLPNLTSINKSSSFLPSCRPYPSNNTVVINSKPLSQICTTPPPPSQDLPWLALPLNSLPSIPSHHIQPPHHVSQTGRQKAEPSTDHDAELGRRAEWCDVIGWRCRGRNECRSGYAGAAVL
jgi:hypothetical protein